MRRAPRRLLTARRGARPHADVQADGARQLVTKSAEAVQPATWRVGVRRSASSLGWGPRSPPAQQHVWLHTHAHAQTWWPLQRPVCRRSMHVRTAVVRMRAGAVSGKRPPCRAVQRRAAPGRGDRHRPPAAAAPAAAGEGCAPGQQQRVQRVHLVTAVLLISCHPPLRPGPAHRHTTTTTREGDTAACLRKPPLFNLQSACLFIGGRLTPPPPSRSPGRTGRRRHLLRPLWLMPANADARYGCRQRLNVVGAAWMEGWQQQQHFQQQKTQQHVRFAPPHHQAASRGGSPAKSARETLIPALGAGVSAMPWPAPRAPVAVCVPSELLALERCARRPDAWEQPGWTQERCGV